MAKNFEITNIDDFVTDFNRPELGLGKLERVSGYIQDRPDAVCTLDGELLVGIEATMVMLPEDEPYNAKKTSHQPDTKTERVLDILMKRIVEKSGKDYFHQQFDQVWLLISAGTFIPYDELKKKIQESPLETKFDRIFIHKGIQPTIIEIIKA